MENKLRILIADDEEIIAKIMEDKLRKEEIFEIIGIAKDKEEEVEMIENLTPHIVLTDIMKGRRDISGLDIIKKYNIIDSKIKFIVISGLDIRMEIVRENMKNIVRIFPKPINLNQLILELKRVHREIYPVEIVNINNTVQSFKKKTYLQRFVETLLKKINL